MADFYTALKSNLKNALCSFLSDAAAYKRAFDKIGPFDTPVSFFPNAPAIALGLFCNKAPSPPTLPPQLVGGQCATGYRARAQGSYVSKDPNNGSETTISINPFPNALRSGTGPLRMVFNGLIRHSVNAGPVWDANPYQVKLSIQFAGEDIYDFVWGPCVRGSVQLIAERTDGLPDNCGNPPIFIPPFNPNNESPPPNVINSPTTFIDNSDNSVTVQTTFDFGIGDINVKGEFNIPVTIKVGPINLEANINLTTGDISFGNSYDNSQDTFYSPSSDDCLPSGRPHDPIPDRPPTSPDPGGSPGTKAKRAVLVGVICKLGNVGQRATLIDPPNPQCPKVIAPYGGLLWFSYKVGNASVFGEDIKLKHDYQYVPCPFPGQAIGYKACGRDTSITVQTTPVYANPNSFKDA